MPPERAGACTRSRCPNIGGAGDARRRPRRHGRRRAARRASTTCSTSSSVPLGVVIGAVVIFTVGLIDDLRKVRGEGVSAPAKIAGMVLAGSVLSLAGVSMIFFRVPFLGIFSLTPDLSALVTVLWVVGMANAINFIDGLDGLAAGITAIAAGSFFLYGARLDRRRRARARQPRPAARDHHRGGVPRLPAVQLPPGQDLHGRLRRAAARPADGGVDDRRRRLDGHGVQRPVVLLLRPAVHPARHPRRADHRHRVRHRPAGDAPRPGWPTADKEHLHHRLMRLGHGQRRSVLILWTWTALLSGFVLYPTLHRPGRRGRPDRDRGPRAAAVHRVPPGAAAGPRRTATTRRPTTTASANGEGRRQATTRRPPSSVGGLPRPSTRVIRRHRPEARLHAVFVAAADGICMAETVCSRLRKYSQGLDGDADDGPATERRELNNGSGEALARAFELVVTPVIFGFFGWLLDGWLGTARCSCSCSSHWSWDTRSGSSTWPTSAEMEAHEQRLPGARRRRSDA